MASWWQKILLTTASLAGLAGGTYYLLTRRPLPRKSGTLHLQSLHEPVEVITDRYGIPHIYAQNEDDLYFAQGYIHAQERLWQMELNRRIGAGRLSELFGTIALEADRFSRRLGMHRAAAEEVARLSEHNKRVLKAYAQGVNAFIEQNQSRLPIEFVLLRFKPEPWKPADTIQWSKMMGWNLGGNWETEIIRARLIAKLGVELASKLEPGYDPAHPLIVPPGIEYRGINLGLLEQYQQVKELSGFGMLGGSNNWVVDGTMTATGSPILCNDPHLGQAAPSIWYECHLVAGDIDVVGASFPGSPGIVIGHNQHIAWGVTNAVSDVEDLYIEKFNPENPYQYEFQGQWHEARVVREVINVRGQKEPVIEEVRITRHGPILTGITQPLNGAQANGAHGATTELPLALRWTGLEQCKIISSIQKLNRATNWTEFLDAMRDWDVPPQNVIYADVEGNIGYIMAGAIPIRGKGQALLPSPGWKGEYEWVGYIPFEELPQSFNPEQHFIATANNRVVDDNYPYYITNEWLNGYRAQRIRDLLTSQDHKLTLADMARIQADYYSLPATEIVPYMLQVQPATPLAASALQIARTWDYRLTAESAGAAIYITFLRKLERLVLGTVLGDDEDLLDRYLGVGSTILALVNGYTSRSRPLLIRLLKEGDDSWFANSTLPNGPCSWNEALTKAFHTSIEELRAKLGADPARWQYGSIHQMTYRHPLGTVKLLSKFFNRGPFPVGGDIDTINMGAVSPAQPTEVITVPSYRQIVNLAGLPSSLSGHSPGQSGHPVSKHYDDFIQMWLEVSHHPMLFERQAIADNAEGTLVMKPR
ncbi:MAG TPA: penicillin acylase family protein [Ktedonobacteraceae bacterium]|nr:penicillin acylase family protein [Ktedonobacteraceae bacterium]